MTADYEMIAELLKRQRQPTVVNGVLSAAVASARDGRWTIGDVIVTAGMGLAFTGFGAMAGAGALLSGSETEQALGIAGDFIRAGALVAAGRMVIDALDLVGWWDVTFGRFLEWYGERHPIKQGKPMIINTRHVAAPRAERAESTQYYALPNGVKISIDKLEHFLTTACHTGVWTREHWCNKADHPETPGVNFLTRSRWRGIRELCEDTLSASVWQTNDRILVDQLLELVKNN